MLFSLFFNEVFIMRRLCPLMIGLASAGVIFRLGCSKGKILAYSALPFLDLLVYLLTVSLGASPRSFLRAAVFQAERSALSLRVCCDNLIGFGAVSEVCSITFPELKSSSFVKGKLWIPASPSILVWIAHLLGNRI